LPPYAHTPGVTPHPVGDPEGHSHGRRHEKVSPPESARWRECEPYLWGIDLFNAGYYWEAHESWEAAWIAAGRRGPTADFLKALIKLAAAGVKLREGNPTGARRHLRRAEELLNGLIKPDPAESRWFGLELSSLANTCRSLASGTFSEFTGSTQPTPVHGLEFRPH
jgi:hypothetical protein